MIYFLIILNIFKQHSTHPKMCNFPLTNPTLCVLEVLVLCSNQRNFLATLSHRPVSLFFKYPPRRRKPRQALLVCSRRREKGGRFPDWLAVKCQTGVPGVISQFRKDFNSEASRRGAINSPPPFLAQDAGKVAVTFRFLRL